MYAYVLCIPSTYRAQKSALDLKELGLTICCVVPYVPWKTTLDYRTQTADKFSNKVIVIKPSTAKVLKNIRKLMKGKDLMNVSSVVYHSIHCL